MDMIETAREMLHEIQATMPQGIGHYVRVNRISISRDQRGEITMRASGTVHIVLSNRVVRTRDRIAAIGD